ncbi:MAG: response regulator [Minwuia sp.]|uniref:response regulator n=1 Tax=Minwuia sp. TaxID=2493630 RepID=UPI003A8912C3
MRILVVDDSKANRNIAKVLLENAGHDVTEAEGGVEALELVTGQEFDVVLMDIAMPEMDGLAATRAIRALEGAKSKTPVVAWTAHDVPGMRGQTCAAGMDAYLTKPIVRHTLLATIAAFENGGGPDRICEARTA